MKKKWVLHHCDLDLWSKVTKFNRVRASAGSNYLAKTASKSVHLFGWNFVHKNTVNRQTDRHTDTHTDKLQWKYNPSTISWRWKNRLHNQKTQNTRFLQPGALWKKAVKNVNGHLPECYTFYHFFSFFFSFVKQTNIGFGFDVHVKAQAPKATSTVAHECIVDPR